MRPQVKQVVLLLLLVPFAAVAGDKLRISSSLDAMGTAFSIIAYDEQGEKLESAVDQAFAEAARLDLLLSNYRKDSEWSRVNREAARRPVRVSSELFKLLEACSRYSRDSGGAFDITVGPLLKLWGFYKGSGRLPHRSEIRNVLRRIGYQHVVLDREHQTVRFDAEGIEIDPGGIGKGYAVDRMVAILRKAGVHSALVSAGGSSVYVLGAPPGKKGWTVKIRNPKLPGETVEELVLNNQSMSTSGNYEKFFYAGGKLYSHIFDPRTGYPAEGVLSVSVVAPLTMDSEAWTKPFFVRGRRWAVENQPKGFRVFLCEERMDLACAWLQ